MKPLIVHSTLLLLAALAAQAKEITVQPAPFKAVVKVEGALLPSKGQPLTIDVEEWGTLTILDVKEQGALVKKGEPLVVLDLEGIDRQIVDNANAARQRELALANAERELANLGESTAWKLAVAERTFERTREDREYFLKIGRALEEEAAVRAVDRAKRSLENQEEELAQLLAMYEEDELTEETEEIILKRQRNAVEDGRYFVRRAELAAKKTLEVDLPRQAADLDQGFKDAELTWTTLQETLPRALEQKKLEVEKLRLDHERATAKEDAVKADREKMSPVAPFTGRLYYGDMEGGKWTAGNAAKYLKVGGAIPPKTIYATLVPEDGPLEVHAFVSEEAIREVLGAKEGTFKPAALSRTALPATVRSVSAYPSLEGTYHLVLDLPPTAAEQGLVPGMKGEATLVTAQRDQALTVPAAALLREPDGSHAVQVKLADGASERRAVVPGVESNGRVEILEGLEAGQVVIIGEDGQ